MNNKDVLDMLKRTYSDNAPDVLHNLDFNKIEKEETKVIPVRRRYYTAAAIYAAACLVVAIALPFLIGRGSDDPKPIPGQSMTNSESVMTGDNTRENDPPETKVPVEIMTEDTDIIDEFMEALDRAVAEGRITGSYDKKECVNVTSLDVFEETGARLFKFADSYRTFIYADGEAYEVLKNEYDPGTTGVAPCDLDGDGNTELLLSVPTNFKRVETKFVLFSLESKTSETIGSITYNIATVTKDIDNEGRTVYPVNDVVFTVDTDNRFMLMPQAGDKLYGYIEVVDGKPAFVLAESTETDTSESPADTVVSKTEADEPETVTIAPVKPEPENKLETIATDKPEMEPETEEKPIIAEPMVSTTKHTTPVETTAPKVTEPPVTTRPSDGLEPDRTYDDPADATKLRFFADKTMTQEYASHKDIPHGAKVYYVLDSVPGYICTNLTMNVYEMGCEKEKIDGTYSYNNYFINTYDGDELEYQLTNVLGGDFDQNGEYNLKDVINALWYIARHPNWYYVYGSNGYASILDYTCDGRTNMLDVSGMMREIAGWNVERSGMTIYRYNAEGVCSFNHLLPLDNAEIVNDFAPKYASGTGYVSVLDGYIVVESVDESKYYNFTDELLTKYTSDFFEDYDLVIFCIPNMKGSGTLIDKVMYNYNKGIVYNYEFNDDCELAVGEPKTVFLPVKKSIGVSEFVPG